MNELTDLYNIVENILNDMDKEELYDGYALSIFKERFDKEFNYYLKKWGEAFADSSIYTWQNIRRNERILDEEEGDNQ